ncbi:MULTISPECIES: hypothetical protein [Streptomyces]|uniref:hypothetical protein n=1 Tax=Streptomyces TaxID=1883 RepID=UPI0004CD8CC6|nr:MULTISPECIES: hypothetical protein [Streptomyces]KOT51142.1 hypothetical protein ADK43_32625 [Streptomyces rimosus subsp. rimosus]
MRASVQVVMLNLQHAAYQSTPGAPIKDYGPQGKGPMGEYLRPTTEAEAAARRPDFERLSAELRERDPGTYAAWAADFEFWRAGDLSVRMPRVDAYAERDENGLRLFRDHRLANTREVAPWYDDEQKAFVWECQRCGFKGHDGDLIGAPRCEPRS